MLQFHTTLNYLTYTLDLTEGQHDILRKKGNVKTIFCAILAKMRETIHYSLSFISRPCIFFNLLIFIELP